MSGLRNKAICDEILNFGYPSVRLKSAAEEVWSTEARWNPAAGSCIEMRCASNSMPDHGLKRHALEKTCAATCFAVARTLRIIHVPYRCVKRAFVRVREDLRQDVSAIERETGAPLCVASRPARIARGGS